jgi:hypothetical protein
MLRMDSSAGPQGGESREMNSYDAETQGDSVASGAERRTARRSPVFYRLDVTGPSKRQVGYLLDVTPEGMRVRCNPDVDISGIGCLSIIFPHWMGLGEKLQVTGRFVWTKPAMEGRIEGGFVFDGLSLKDVARLEDLIEIVVKAATEDELL